MKSFINWLQNIGMGLSLFDFLMRIIKGSKEQSLCFWKKKMHLCWSKGMSEVVGEFLCVPWGVCNFNCPLL